ncbi:MAG TPA: DUF2244 domain-containing protein [Burkholderiales bacterium]|nr:DUF2244 domain-containing protein [Burkholderiales bacterium]
MALSEAASFSLTMARRSSLTPGGRRAAFWVVVAVSAAIAAGFAAAGAWVILPFSGLEIAFLYWVLRLLERQAGDFERITVAGDTLILESVEFRHARRMEFNRYWAQVVLGRDRVSGHPRVALKSHGREVEIGRYMDDNERLALAGELRRRTGFNTTNQLGGEQ